MTIPADQTRSADEAGGAPDVLVVIGVGGMGQAIARRLGSGRTVLLADLAGEHLESVAAALAAEGHLVAVQPVDVSDEDQVTRLADVAQGLGPVRSVVHTAGLSPVQASTASVLRVDLVGVALVLDAFVGVVAPGGAAVVIASMAGHMAAPIPPEDEQLLATSPAQGLLDLECVRAIAQGDSGLAYAFAKRANRLRVQAVSVEWGRRGARVNSVSPGIISTPMGAAELAGPTGEFMRVMIEGSGTKRLGTPDDIASAAEFLLGAQASFVTGTDLLVDGGVVGGLLAARPAASADWHLRPPSAP